MGNLESFYPKRGGGSPVRLVFDHLPLTPVSTAFGMTGVGLWTLNALNHLKRLAPGWSIESLEIGLRQTPRESSRLDPEINRNHLRFPRKLYLAMEVFHAVPPLETSLGPVDAMLGTAYVTRRTRSAAEIPVIYDLSVFKYSRTHPQLRVRYLQKRLPSVLARAALVVTISETMRREVADYFSLDPGRIAVVSPGCALSGAAPNGRDGSSDPEPYLLAVGTLEPRKNLGRLLAAYRRLKKRRPGAPRLVLVGGMGWRANGLNRTLGQHLDAGDVEWKGYLPEPALSELYRNAAGFVYPSLYEGFGMPVLEAMAAGCPVVTSRGTAMAEVAGDAAILTDPEDIEDMEQAIERLIDDGRLTSEMKAAGLQRAKGFTWEATARQLKEAVETAVKWRRT